MFEGSCRSCRTDRCTFDTDGTNLYMALAALFVAQATGIHLTLIQQLPS
jgi:Na+/H+-dicarboxylate symporter